MAPQLGSDEIRDRFLRFFHSREHERIGSGRLVPVNDPTLLFINSGMAPLKPYFTGQQEPPSKRLCNVQPCLRTKDIEDVGDRHHLTFFEMLGSWSIGDYFKEGAVELAYELLVDHLGFDPERLWISVFGGDEGLGIEADETAARAWESVGIPPSRIMRFGMADNFWGPAGDTGPCGPCTEVFYDFGPEYGPEHVPGEDFSSRYIEIWNAGVFMQFDKGHDGSLTPLPFTSVDTGAGLERLVMAMNEQPTVYDTDVLKPLVELAGELMGEPGEPTDQHRLLADHLRAATFILAEGVRPSNEGRGYIPRRLIRKSIAVAMTHGGGARTDLQPLAEAVIARMGESYPLLDQRRDEVLGLLREEQDDFERAVGRGLDHLRELTDGGAQVTGRDAFRLFSTYGLPLEITRDLSREQGASVDEEGFRAEFRAHQERSRGVAGGGQGGAKRLSSKVGLADLPPVAEDQFVGYETLETTGRVLALYVDGERRDAVPEGDAVELLADRTSFYGEGGGQVGDRGVVEADGLRVEIEETVKHPTGYHVHRGRVALGELRAGDEVRFLVDPVARAAAEANHSATHLLNAALRRELGEHVKQAGSLVEPGRLRFDFTHPAPLTPEQLTALERDVNEEVFAHRTRTTTLMDRDEAKASGARSLEGEEYADVVRVVRLGPESVELCGGTHVDDTSEIGFFRIVQEGSVAAGVRRISAVTGKEALELTLQREGTLNDVTAQLKTNVAQLPDRVRQLVAAGKSGGGKAKASGGGAVAASQQVPLGGGATAALARVDDPKALREAALDQAARHGSVAVVLASGGDRVSVAVVVPKELEGSADARALLNAVLGTFGAKGGGNPRLAQGGGPGDIDAVLAAAPEALAAA